MTETRFRAPASSHTTQQFLRGLRIAVLVVTLTILARSGIFRNLARYDPAGLEVLAYVVLAAIVGIEAVLVIGRHEWGSLRWPALVLAVAASVAAIAALPDSAAVTSADWAFGTVGWMYVILTLDRPLAWLASLLMLHEGLTIGGVLLSGPVEMDVWLNLAAGSLGALGYPLAAGAAATALRAVASSAEKAVREAASIRTADEVAARLHGHRQWKFADLYERTVPLLQGFADQSLDPSDMRVQRACAIEAARMRRLFAEGDTAADPLLYDLRHCADVADRRGVLIEIVANGEWPTLPTAVRHAIAEAPIAALATAQSYARVTVVGTREGLVVGVVADCGPLELSVVDNVGVQLNSVADGDIFWVEAQWSARDV